LAFVTFVPTCLGPPTSWKSLIVCPDLQLARSDLSLPKIVITVPEWTLPRGVLSIVRCVAVTVVAASATQEDGRYPGDEQEREGDERGQEITSGERSAGVH